MAFLHASAAKPSTDTPELFEYLVQPIPTMAVLSLSSQAMLVRSFLLLVALLDGAKLAPRLTSVTTTFPTSPELPMPDAHAGVTQRRVL